jgi:autotransporter-associated beta strand protein
MKKGLWLGLIWVASMARALVVNDLTTITVSEGVTNSIEGYVVGTNTLVKAGAGELVWTNAFTFGGETRLDAGSLRMVSEPFNTTDSALTNLLGQSVFWVDASDDASFTYNTTTNEDLTVTTNSVETWSDKLSRNTATAVATNANRIVKPARTGSKNGLPTVDFGPQGNGASMDFTRVSTIRTVFWVVDINPASAMFLLGDTGTWHFHRNDTTAAYWGGNTSGNVRDGSTYNNGVRVTTPTTTLIPTGYQMISLTTLGTVQANALCRDRDIAGRNGGQRIAEILIYDRVLTEAERKIVEAYLRKKWATATESTADYNRLSALTIAGENTGVSKEGDSLFVGNLKGVGTSSVNFPDGATFENGLVLAGTLGITIPSGPLSLSTVYGTGTFNPSHPLLATTVTLTNNLTINQAVTLTTLQGEKTFDATSLSVSNVVPNNTANALIIDIPAADRSITNIIANGGTVQVPDLLTVLGKIQVGAGQTLTLQNSAAGITAPLLTGNGSITLPGGAITVGTILAAAGETLTINYGAETWTVPPLIGTGKVKFAGTGALTINQPDLFTGTIELAPEMAVTVTGTNPFFNKLEIHGTNTLVFPSGMTECGVTNLIGNGQLQGTNTATGVTMNYSRIDMTGNMHLIDAGVGPLTVPDVRGTGTLTSNRGVMYDTITLAGTFNLQDGQEALKSLSGAGTLNIANVSRFTVESLASGGNVVIVNTGLGTVPLTIANLGGTGSLTVTNGLGEAVITNFVAGTDVTFTLNTGTNSVTVRRSFGEGTLVKQGSGTLFFGQHSTLQALRIANDSKIVALPADVIDNPVQGNLSFWLDASQAATITLGKDTANNDVITEWRDVRETYNPWQAESPYDSAYQVTQNAKPVIGRYTLNGRNVADMGPLGSHNDGNARWMQFRDGQTARTVIMVFGSQAGGNMLLTASANNNYHRGSGASNDPLTPVFASDNDWTFDAVEFGKLYLDATEIYNSTQVGFNGNYQIVSVLNRNNETAYANRFANDRDIGGRCGGQRIAEALFYSEKLTDAQRIAVEGYLTAKWKPRMPRLEVATATVEVDTTQSPLAIDVIVGSGNVTKTGANDLTVQDAGGLSGTLHISSGKLATTEALYKQTPQNLNNWYDAASTNNFTFETDGRINTWKSSTNSPGTDAQRNSGTDLAWSPYYDPYGLNGKPVVDMGVWNGERRLRLANEYNGICSAFMVYDSRFGGGWLFGGRTSYNFHRGDNGGNLNAGMVDGTAAAAARYSTLWQNGVQTATDLTQAYFKGDWETIVLKTSGSVLIGSLGQDRTDASGGLTHRTGGKRLAEVLLYWRTVTSMERLYIERYLNNKWFGRFRNLSFADNTTFELGEGTKDVFVAKITGTGRVTQTGTSKLDVYDTTTFTGTWVADIAKLNLIRKLAPTAPQPTPDNWWLDASKTNTLTLGDGSYSAGGTLNTWADQSVAGATATNVGTVTWRPNLLNGMPVVDLGDAAAANYMTYQNRTVASGFAIFGSQQGGSFFFGHTVNYHFHRSEDQSSTGPLLWGENNDHAASFVRRGQWKMDGDRYDPRRTVSGTVASYRNMSGNYSLYSFATRAGTTANTDQLSRDRTGSGGRQRLGEIIFHSGLIAPTNRAATEAYLMNKWFGKSVHGYVSERAPLFQTLELPAGASQSLTINTGVAGQAVAIGTIIGATNVSSTGTGKLIVGAINATRTVPTGTESVVVGRELPLTNPVTDSLDLWVDANSPSEAFSVAGNNGRLNRWSDVRDIGNAAGRGMFAYNDGTALWGSTILGPLLQPNALNGKTVADFGAFNSKNWMGFVTGANTYRNINTMRTLFWVYNSEAGGGWLMGHITSHQFHRGDQVNNTITKNIPIFAPNDGWAASQVKLGSFYADGQQINPMITGMSGGWQIFSLVTSANAEASTFARDRANSGDGGNIGQRTGGQKLAEMLIYNRVLTETERRDVEAYLAYKWFNRINNGYRLAQGTDVQEVTLAQGATLTFANANGTFKVAGSGTVTGTVVTASEVSPAAGGITFASGLTLVDGAVVKRAADGADLNAGKVTVAGGLTVQGGGTLNVTAISGNVSGQQFPLFGYDTLSGSFAGWNLSGVVTGKFTPQFKDNDPANTASVRLNPAGTLILFR